MRLYSLEPRLLRSVAFNESTGYIEVTTGRHSDVVYANMRHGRLKITVNGVVDSTWRLRRVAGLQIETGRGNDAVTLALSVPLPCSIIGDSGNDTLAGANDADTLLGGAGDDILTGFAGNDALYGGPGADGLIAGDGRDALFGGIGDADSLDGQAGDDRFLLPENADGTGRYEDITTANIADGDSRIWFRPGDRAWSDAEVQALDTGLAILHLRMNGTQLLRMPAGFNQSFHDGDQVFVRGANSPTDAATNNRIGYVTVYDGTFGAGPAFTTFVPIHELGHNWDESTHNPYWATGHDFRALSNWAPHDAADPVPAGQTLSGDGHWTYATGTTFETQHARDNPYEDFADSFAAYLQRTRRHFGNPAKWDYIDAFLVNLKSSS
jgi:hypothetical protein